MEQVSLKQIFFGGVTMQVPEIWNVETEELQEFDGQKFVELYLPARTAIVLKERPCKKKKKA